MTFLRLNYCSFKGEECIILFACMNQWRGKESRALSSVSMLWWVVGVVLGGGLSQSMYRWSKSQSREAFVLSLALENIQLLETGNGLKRASYRKTWATLRTHQTLPSSKVSSFREKKWYFHTFYFGLVHQEILTEHLLYMSHYSGTRTYGLAFLFCRTKSRVGRGKLRYRFLHSAHLRSSSHFWV